MRDRISWDGWGNSRDGFILSCKRTGIGYNARVMTQDQPNNAAVAGSSEEELIAVRREKVEKLRALGVNPYGGRFEVSTSPSELKADFAEEKQVRLLGRITGLRDMGKTQFFTLSDVCGSIQCMLTKKAVSEKEWSVWKLLERGDWLGVQGRLL